MSYESFGIKRAYNEPVLSRPIYERCDMSVKIQFSFSLVVYCIVLYLVQIS